ncbi:hypothetical protein D3C87_105250 [compost metagenome]
MKVFLSALLMSALMFSVAGPVEARKAERMMSSEASTSTLQDTVKKIRDDDEGVVVLFTKAKGNYYLRRDVRDFDASREKLNASLSEKKPVSVIFESETLNIVDVK